MTTESIEIPGYRIEGILGIGGFGKVLAAAREDDGLPVAIKTVHREDIAAHARLLFEAEALHAIGPPHVPELYEQGTLPDGRPYFVFENLLIPSLDRELGKPLAPDVVAELVGPILDALAAAHDKGFLHRDIKPENIFVGGSPPVAKLIDFGLAKPLQDQPRSMTETATGIILGTPTYMSPEQCDGRRDLDARSDIYSLGIVLYEMLSGVAPFSGDPASVRIAHLTHRPPSLGSRVPVAPELDVVVLRCLAKEADGRYSDVASLRQDLLRALALPVPDDMSGRRPAGRHGPRTSARMLLVGALYFEASTSVGQVTRLVKTLGGSLAAVTGKRCVVVFGATGDIDPLERAVDGARRLIEQGVADKITVDRDRVRVVRRRDGSERMVAASFLRSDRFPAEGDPSGVLVTSRTATTMAEKLTAEVPGRAGVVQLVERDADSREMDPSSSALVGREGALDELIADARLVAQESLPGLATVLARPGHGKSALASALVAALRGKGLGFHIIELYPREAVSGHETHLLPTLVRAALCLPEAASADQGRRALIGRLGRELASRLWPALALLCGWIDPDDPQVLRLRAAPTALRSAAAQATGELLRRLATERPVCCILDDAHLADDTMLDALEYATLAEGRVPLWVCVLARPSFAEARPLWGKRATRARSQELGPLDADAAAELCRRLLRPARDIPEQTITRLVEQTQGSPLFLTELARGIKRSGLIRQHGRGEAWYLATDDLDAILDLPGVEWLAERELAAVPLDLAAHAQLVSVLGTSFTGAEVAGVLRELEIEGLADAFPLDAVVGNRQLCNYELLLPCSDDMYEFRHAVIREQIARRVPSQLQTQIHRAAFQYYRDTGQVAEERRLPLVAYHAAQCGQSDTAAALYLELAEAAQGRHDYVNAGRLYSRTLELISDSPDRETLSARMRALGGRGLMYSRLSRFDDALGDLHEARAIAERLDDSATRVEILLDEATVLDWLRDFAHARERVEEALAAAPRSASPLIRARLALGRGRAYHRLGNNDVAMRWLETAATDAGAIGDAGYETRVVALMLLGFVLALDRDLDRAHQVFETCVALCRERGDKLHLAAVLNNRSELWRFAEDVDRAVADALASQALGREIGQLSVEYTTAFNVAELYYFVGDLASAEPHLRRAVELESITADKPEARLLAARLAALAGDRERARTELAAVRAAEAQARADGNPSGCLDPADEVLFHMVELAVAGADVEKWQTLRARAQEIAPAVTRVEIAELMGVSMMRQGQVDLAGELLADALAMSGDLRHIIETRIRSRCELLGS